MSDSIIYLLNMTKTINCWEPYFISATRKPILCLSCQLLPIFLMNCDLVKCCWETCLCISNCRFCMV